MVDAGNAHKLPFELFPFFFLPHRKSSIDLGVQRVPFLRPHILISKKDSRHSPLHSLSSTTSHVGRMHLLWMKQKKILCFLFVFIYLPSSRSFLYFFFFGTPERKQFWWKMYEFIMRNRWKHVNFKFYLKLIELQFVNK